MTKSTLTRTRNGNPHSIKGVDKFEHQKAAVKDPRLTHAQYRVLMFVWSFMSQEGTGWVSREHMYKELPVTREHMDTSLKSLKERGYLTVTSPGGRNKGGSGKSTEYALTLPAEPAPSWEEWQARRKEDRAQKKRAGAEAAPRVPVENLEGTTRINRGVADLNHPDELEENHPDELAKPPGSSGAHHPHITPVENPGMASPSATSPGAPVDNDGCHAISDQEEKSKGGTVLEAGDLDDGDEVLTTLDALLSSDGTTPATPEHLAQLDGLDPVGGWDAHEDDGEHHEDPHGPRAPHVEPQEPVSGPAAAPTTTRTPEAPTPSHDAPGAALAARRAHGHPARTQQIATALGNTWRMPA